LRGEHATDFQDIAHQVYKVYAFVSLYQVLGIASGLGLLIFMCASWYKLSTKPSVSWPQSLFKAAQLLINAPGGSAVDVDGKEGGKPPSRCVNINQGSVMKLHPLSISLHMRISTISFTLRLLLVRVVLRSLS